MVFTLSHAFKSGHVSANDVCILRHTRRGAQTRTHFALRLRELRRRFYRSAPLGKDTTKSAQTKTRRFVPPCQCSRRKLRLVRNSRSRPASLWLWGGYNSNIKDFEISALRQQGEQFGFHIFSGWLRVINNSCPEQLIHVRTKSTVGQMPVQQLNKLGSSGNAAFQF